MIADVFYRSGCNSSISAEHLLQLSAEAPVLASIAAASAATEQEQRHQIADAPRRKDPFATLSISSVKNIARFMSIEDLVSFRGRRFFIVALPFNEKISPYFHHFISLSFSPSYCTMD